MLLNFAKGMVLSMLILSSNFLHAQNSVDSVKATINRLFTAMKNADGPLLKTCFADSMVFQGISDDATGKTIIKNRNPEDFIRQVSAAKKGSLDEQIVFEQVHTDANLAIAWTPYQFFLNGQFSHCGVNSFQLIRIDGAWKIQYLIDTRRKGGCR